VPTPVLDLHGQFADPDNPFVQRAHPTVLDAAKSLPFAPFECSRDAGSNEWKSNALAVSEIFGYVAGLGDMQRDVVYQAIGDADRAVGFGDPAGDSLPGYPTREDVLARIEERERSRHVPNVTARCRPLLEMDLFRPQANEPDLLTQIHSGLVIDLHNLYAETLQLAAGAFVLRKIYKDMFRTNYPESRKIAGVIRVRQGQDLPAQIEQLTVGSAYVQTPEMPLGTVVQMYPLEDSLSSTGSG
jgi:DNA phosphorothioation-dependent restriction protein DptH